MKPRGARATTFWKSPSTKPKLGSPASTHAERDELRSAVSETVRYAAKYGVMTGFETMETPFILINHKRVERIWREEGLETQQAAQAAQALAA